MVHFAGPSQRNRAFAATALAFLMAGLSPAGAAAYTQDSWQSGYDVHQQTACWCVVASSLSWLNYVPGATHPSQSSLSAQITSTVDNSSQGDKYNWKAHSSGPCSDGSGTYGHDPRGEAGHFTGIHLAIGSSTTTGTAVPSRQTGNWSTALGEPGDLMALSSIPDVTRS